VSIEIGQVIDGKYRVVKLLGKGGMGAVYLAEHMVIGRRVALKVLHGNVAENENAVARFEREAQAAGRIGNDHILEVFDFGSLADGSRYMVCEYLEGETLASRMTREGRLTPAALVPIARQLLNGLGAAHEAGVVHRDLKPENVFVLRQKAGWADFVKIIDFGISKFQPLSTGEGLQMTATGIVVGTPCYLSPEQARGSREADPRSDLYAVGVMLYEAVTGVLPFNAQNVNDLLFKIVLESPTPILEAAPDTDPAFAQIIQIAMARDAENRFASAADFSQALESWAAERGIPVAGPTLTRSGSGSFAPSGSGGLAPARPSNAPAGETKPGSGATHSLAPTPGTWADSQISALSVPITKKPTFLKVAAVLGVLLFAGIGFALYKSASSPEDPKAAASAPSNDSSSLQKPSTPLADELARSPKALPPESPPPAVAPALPPAAEVRSPPPITALPKPPPAPASPAKVAPQSKAATQPKAPAKPKAATQPSSPSRRRLDFGY